ncbi:MAG: MotA/TolQ/ExbB proton channel family protein [Bacteroidales bacterium]|jgi:biopolymer transport protein ExbB|nr:MotA/TolQ/ExbB proton channel family protein [Bacteroidales bacterium]
MKKLIALLGLACMLSFCVSSVAFAQGQNQTSGKEQVATENDVNQIEETPADEAPVEEEVGLHQQLKIKFIEGGPMWMAPILICFIIGLAVAFEKIIYLNLASTNTKKLLIKLETTLNESGIEAAKEVCRKTRGPVASIFFEGLDRYDSGLDIVEKSVVSYGSVQTGLLEKGLSWISLFIAIGPMLGFLGTVVGMIQAFDAIQIAGDINPTLVAGGMKVALITTVGGLIVALVLQVFYNYILSKIDSIVGDMEDASISLIDMLMDYSNKK